MNKCNCEGHRGDSHFCPLHGEVTHPDHAVKAEQSPQTEQAEASSLSDGLLVQIKDLFKELDEKHHLSENEYFRTKSKFDHGRTAALGEACSKLQRILNGYQ